MTKNLHVVTATSLFICAADILNVILSVEQLLILQIYASVFSCMLNMPNLV